eukprot:TRINITY_DN104549_c0_g1_i1.p1 TRINITY_DN104549_c0_g1~~TRINITY_DN104549_c0_g1_i1.p1  ORF type:complete len:220 (+),score=35.75 TRINITY_DN104549_c0_g1_i1:34-660(+)
MVLPRNSHNARARCRWVLLAPVLLLTSLRAMMQSIGFCGSLLGREMTQPAARVEDSRSRRAAEQGFGGSGTAAKKLPNVKDRPKKDKKASLPVEKDESEEERNFRERYLEADKESGEGTQKFVDDEFAKAGSKEEKFKVAMRLGAPGQVIKILGQEWAESFISGDKERLDNFLEAVGVPSWLLTVISVVVAVFAWGLIGLSLGWFKAA